MQIQRWKQIFEEANQKEIFGVRGLESVAEALFWVR
jgi:hypothetical protein